MYFEYGENEITYLRNKDKKLSEVIDQIGMIEREVDTDLFSAVVHHIIGQQISTKAQATIWQRMKETLGEVNAVTIRTLPERFMRASLIWKKSLRCRTRRPSKNWLL